MDFPIRNKYKWADNVCYDLVYNNGSIIKKREESCYSRLPNNDPTLNKIILYNINCELTKEYRDWYLQYIIDMLKLKASFDDKSFTFEAFTSKYKNMLVCSLVRILWERMFQREDSDNVNWFLKPLYESTIRGKMKRFCTIYSKINIEKEYLHDGHLWEPWKTKIKTTKEWVNSKSISSVNGFFIN